MRGAYFHEKGMSIAVSLCLEFMDLYFKKAGLLIVWTLKQVIK